MVAPLRHIGIAALTLALSSSLSAKKPENLTTLTTENFQGFTAQPAAIVEVTGFGKEAKAYHQVFAAYCASHTEIPCGSVDMDKPGNISIATGLGVQEVPRTFFYKDGKAGVPAGAMTAEELAEKVKSIYAP